MNVTEDAGLCGEQPEMNQKSRPELVGLEEEFYHAYQASAPFLGASNSTSRTIPGVGPGGQSDALDIGRPASFVSPQKSAHHESGLKAIVDVEDAPSASSSESSPKHDQYHASCTDSEAVFSTSFDHTNDFHTVSVNLKEAKEVSENENMILTMKSGKVDAAIPHLNFDVSNSHTGATVLEEENDRLKEQLKPAILAIEGKEVAFRKLQEELSSVKSSSGSTADLLNINQFLNAQVEDLNDKLSRCRAQNLQIQEDMASQLEFSNVLREDATLLREENNAGKKELAEVRREVAGQYSELEAVRRREQELKLELSNLSAVVDSLRHSLAERELENSNMEEILQKSRDCLNAAQKEVRILQGEKQKWLTGAAETKKLSDKIASLRSENAGLHAQLAVLTQQKQDHLVVLKQQKQLESLPEEPQTSSQAAGMSELRDDLQMYKDIIIPSMEERELELRGVIQDLTAANESLVSAAAADYDKQGLLIVAHEGDIRRLSEENHSLREENSFLRNQSEAAWVECSRMENTVKDLEATKATMQEKNNLLYSEVNTGKEDRMQLQAELTQLQQSFAALAKDMEASIEESRTSEETMRMLDGVIGSLERSNRRLKTENGLTGEQLKALQGVLRDVQDNGAEAVAQLKKKNFEALDELKATMSAFGKQKDDADMSPHAMVSQYLGLPEHQGFDEAPTPITAPESGAKDRFLQTELQQRTGEANLLVEAIVGLRKMISSIFTSSEHVFSGSSPLRTTPAVSTEEEDAAKKVQLTNTNLHHEFLELMEGRKLLKEELELQFEELQKMEQELQTLETLNEGRAVLKRDGRIITIERKNKNRLAGECVNVLRNMLAQRRSQICRMEEEISYDDGEDEQEGGTEDQMTVLASADSAPSVEGMDEHQMGLLSKELESLRLLTTRQSAELQTISLDLQSMGSIIKAIHDQPLLQQESLDAQIEDIAFNPDFGTPMSDTAGVRHSDASFESARQSSALPEVDLVSPPRTSSDGGPGLFPLRHTRNFMTWLPPLFGPERKASGLARGKSGKSSLASALSTGRIPSLDTARQKIAACYVCVGNSRVESFDLRQVERRGAGS